MGWSFFLPIIYGSFFPLILSLWSDHILNKRHNQPCYFEFCTSFFFFLCESQGANTRKRGRLSHMLRLIYLKVLLRAQSLDAWILLAWVWWMKILQFLVFTSQRNRVGSFIFSGIRKMLVSALWLHKFAVPASHVLNWALLQSFQ